VSAYRPSAGSRAYCSCDRESKFIVKVDDDGPAALLVDEYEAYSLVSAMGVYSIVNVVRIRHSLLPSNPRKLVA
jgi:hypothetical protein